MDVNFQEQVFRYLSENTYDAVYQEEVSELYLPESLPQIERVIDCSATVCMQSKDAGSGSVTVSGVIKACVVYQPEEGTLQKAEKELPFTVRKELPEAEGQQTVFYQGWIKRIDARMLGGRKMLLRANLGSRFTVYAPASLSIYVPQEVPKELQLLKNTYELMLPGDCGEKEFRMNEEALLPETAAGISEILKSSAAFQVTETKTVGDKAVLKGSVLLHLLYTASTGTVHGFDTELPFSQYIDLGTDFEDGDVRVGIQLLSAETETDGQEDAKRVFVNLNALAQAVVYTKKRIELYEDAYVTKGNLSPQWQEVSVQARLDSQTVTVGAELAVPAMTEKVLDASVYPDQPVVRREESSARLIMPVHANVIYLDKDGAVQSKEAKGEITYDDPLAPDAGCAALGAVYGQPVSLASYDTVTLRMTAHFCIDSYMGSRLRTVHGAVIEPEEKRKTARPSLIARKAGGEAVWDIAKSCGSTVEAICEANGLTAGVVQEGAILLIPIQ